MSQLSSEFDLAVQQLDELTEEGFFGSDALSLKRQRDNVSMSEHLMLCFDNWIGDNSQYGKEIVARLIIIVLKLYVDVWRAKGQEAIDIVTSIWSGTPSSPHLECTTAFLEALRVHVEYKNASSELSSKGRPATVAEKKRLTSALTSAYAKGIEYIGKVIPRFVALLKLEQNEPYQLETLSEKTIYDSFEEFTRLSNGRYDIIIANLDRGVRNAESHLAIIYDINKNAYVIRERKGKKRVIPLNDMVLKVYPAVGWVMQAFTFASIPLVLANEDQQEFTTRFNKVVALGKIAT